MSPNLPQGLSACKFSNSPGNGRCIGGTKLHPTDYVEEWSDTHFTFG